MDAASTTYRRRYRVNLIRLVKQRQVNHVAHDAIAEVARMQPVAAIVFRQHLCWILGIPQVGIEIDHAVKGAAGTDPVIECETVLFAARVPGSGQVGLVAEWRQGRSKQLDVARLRSERHLVKACDHLVGSDLLLETGTAVAQVVGAELTRWSISRSTMLRHVRDFFASLAKFQLFAA